MTETLMANNSLHSCRTFLPRMVSVSISSSEKDEPQIGRKSNDYFHPFFAKKRLKKIFEMNFRRQCNLRNYVSIRNPCKVTKPWTPYLVSVLRYSLFKMRDVQKLPFFHRKKMKSIFEFSTAKR